MTAILVLVAAAQAASGEASSPSSPSPRTLAFVESVVAGAPRELPALEAALAESLGRQGLGLAFATAGKIAPDEVTRAPHATDTAEHVVARLRLDLTSLPLAKLYLLDGERRRVYVRWLSLPRGLDPVAVELIRFVVESSVEAIRAGRDIGVSREEYDSSLIVPAKTHAATGAAPAAASASASASSPIVAVSESAVPQPPPVALVAAARYEGVLVARGHYQQGPGISVSARLPQIWIGADFLLRLPMTIVGDAANARTYAAALRVTAAIPVLSSRQVSLAAGVGGGIDVSHVQPTASRADLIATPPFWATSPFLRLFATAERRFGRLSVAALIGVDVDLLGERYVVATASGKQEVFAPGRARPLAAILFGIGR